MEENVNNKDKINHIAYLKTPKTGSTTTAVILIRYGIRNKLKMYLPLNKTGVNDEEQKQLIRENKTFDIFTIHTHFNKTFFEHIVPRGSAIIGQVRDPLQRVISNYFFSKYGVIETSMPIDAQSRFIHNVINKTLHKKK